jgi:hypothetical protein
MAYIGKIEKGSAMSFHGDIKIHNMLSYNVVWRNEVDGKEALACNVARLEENVSAATKAKAKKKLDDYVQRYASYAERKGVRFEVLQREKQERKRRIRMAPTDATSAIVHDAVSRFRKGEQVDGLVLGQELRKLPQAELEAAAANLLIEVSRRAEASARRS